jgi:branched-chain amino acid transport system substrate-binding protein
LIAGLQCDRPAVGTSLCPRLPGRHKLFEQSGGIEDNKLKAIEIDHEYKVPAMGAHERFKKDGAVIEGVYGTPPIAALNK